MMKCVSCGTAWSTSGLPVCPVCGARVGDAADASGTSKEDRRPDPVPMISYPTSDSYRRKSSNGSAVFEISTELRKSESHPTPPKALLQDPTPTPVLSPETKKVDPAPAIAPLPAAPLEAHKATTRLFRVSPAILPAQADAKTPPAPAKPMIGPLILGFLAFVPTLLLPLTLAFEGSRVMGILGFCMTGFFAPFAPIAWTAGLYAEKRRRDQGLRSEPQISAGRLLGQCATLILVAEMTLALVGIAALRLSGKFPPSFRAYF